MGEVVRRARSFRVLTRAHLTADGSSTVGVGSKEIQEFQNWIQTAARQLVVGKTGAESWVGVYVRAAYARGWYRAESMIQRSAIPNADRPLALTVGAATELEGIVAETYRQISRVFIDAVARAARPRELAGLVADRIEKILVTRGRAMAQFAVVKAHNRATLDAFRDAGVRRVGIDPEYLPKPKAKTTLDSMFVRDAKTRKLKASRRKATKTAADDPEIVDILTAGDDLVCQQCEDIADSGPYDIDTAQDLIPAHPNCRCAFVPSFDQRFAHDAGPPDEERDDHGRWSGGGGTDTVAHVHEALTDNETKALKDYTTDWLVNDSLREHAGDLSSLEPDEQEAVRHMDAALAKSRLKSDVVVYRGLSPRMGARMNKMDAGQVTKQPGYTSTSISLEQARGFAGEGGGIMEIHAAAGMHAVDMTAHAAHENRGETEVLFGRSARMRYDGTSRGIHRFTAL